MNRLRIALIALGVAVVLVVLGLFLGKVSERSIKDRMAEELTTILKADVNALLLWMDDRQENVSYFAGDQRVAGAIRRLGAASQEGAASVTLRRSSEAQTLRSVLDEVVAAFEYTHYFALDIAGRIVASSNDSLVGASLGLDAQASVGRMAAGDTVVTLPLDVGETGTGERTIVMFVGAPVLDGGGVGGVLAFGVAPERGFSDILRVARSGESGETYAFDSTGLMISNSRFDEELKQIGLIPNEPGARSVRVVQIRDPGTNLTRNATGERVSQLQFPLTKMAADAFSRNFDPQLPDSVALGFDVDGYNDYRGVPVIGAWTWLPEYGFGVATEVDVAEAFSLLIVMRRVLWSVFGLLALTALVLVGSSFWINRLRHDVMEAKDVGQYRLEKKIGEGGMGRVYRARHALLRRPTAVKLLLPEKHSDVSIKRFEREVRHTSTLSHPNTVAIYDYGRTPDGVFYYAMEYLPGVDLDVLINTDGQLPPGRAVHILKQACGALAEAHDSGLVHRDIKPSNIMLTERGGLFDFVKVLDFGLVRNVDQSTTMNLTSEDLLVGTPLYMAPEAFKDPQAVTAQADIYSLGAVGYFMLSGEHAFDAPGVTEVIGKHLSGNIVPISERRGEVLDPHFDQLLMRCLAKEPHDRPNAAELHDALDALDSVPRWSAIDARAWWESNATRADKDGTWKVDFARSAPTASRPSISRALRVELDKRGETGASK